MATDNNNQSVLAGINSIRMVPLSKGIDFTLETQEGVKECTVVVTTPNGKQIPAYVTPQSNGFHVRFSPTEVGSHQVMVLLDGVAVQGFPFSCKVYDVSKVNVTGLETCVVGKPVTFQVDACQAGEGTLELVVTTRKSSVRAEVVMKRLGLYNVTFVPLEKVPHYLIITFNGQEVPGAPFTCMVLDSSKIVVSKDELDRVAVLNTATFFVHTNGIALNENSVTIFGPTHKPVKATLSGDQSNGYKVEFAATEVGDHIIDVKVAGNSIPGCPFLVKAYDAKKVRISEITSGAVGKPIYFSIDASQAGAGNLEIIVSVNGRNVPNYVQSEGNAKFRVNFKPAEPSTHMLSVKFNGEAVPGSPYLVKVIENSQSVISGNSLRMAPLSKGVDFTVETQQGVKECSVLVTSPSGKRVPVEVTPQGNDFHVHFQPTEVGSHQVMVLLDGVAVQGFPFSCKVYDVSKVNVTGLETCIVGKPATFQVDASQAGEGTLELVVTTRKSSVRAEVLMKSRGLYNVTFVPLEKVPHFLNITFNESDVPGNPFKIDVSDDFNSTPSQLQRSILGNNQMIERYSTNKNGLVGLPNVIEFECSGPDDNLECKVIGPQNAIVPCNVSKTNNRLKLEYQPKEIGTHKIDVTSKGESCLKTPLTIEVCDPSRVKVTNVQDGIVGREQQFKIDASRAGTGTLNVLIKAAGEKEVKATIRELSGVYAVTYIPHIDLPHSIDVQLNGHSAPGLPQVVEIRDPTHSIIVHGDGLRSAIPGKITTFIIETGGFAAAKDFDVLITDPAGSPLPVKCYQQKDNSLLTEWVPVRTGHHKIEVFYLEKHVAGSPFSCEAFDASKVILQKIKTTNFPVKENILFTLNRHDAGYAGLEVTATSPLGRLLPIEVKGTSDGDGEVIEFVPLVPGKYKIAITFGGIEVPGSPIIFTAHEGKMPKLRGNGLLVGNVGDAAVFQIDTHGLSESLDVRIDGPDSEVPCTITEERSMHTVSYTPLEIGSYNIRIFWNGKEIPDSPFHPNIVNLQNVCAIGGWENIVDSENKVPMTVNIEKRMSFDVTNAGRGKLSCVIKGPNGEENVSVEQTSNYKYRISFTPKSEGEYKFHLSFADMPLPNSPLIGYAVEGSHTNDCATVVLRGHGLAGARVGEEAEFTIDGTDAGPGQPEVTLTGVKADIVVTVAPCNGSSKIFKATYIPSVQGTYLLNVVWGHKQVKGCPLKISILASCDSGRVICSGEGLRGGALGKEIKAFIDTRRAGPGELTAHCMGPSKIAYCELYDQLDGTFTLFVKPQESGKHTLNVKYGGDHVAGSPFTLRVAGAPDASKVKVMGPGIEHGVLPIYQSRFICDTRGAGAGQLTVRIRGPKGAFRVEMQRESQKDRTILCKYDPTEPGDYRIEVKWSGQNVPGSPFNVMIFDTQDELSRFLAGQFPTPSILPNFLPPLNASEYYAGNYSTGFGQMSWRGSTAVL